MDRLFGSFYRYRAFPDAGSTEGQQEEERRRITSMFAERIFWFANPSTLNDPFDCRPVLLWSEDMAANRRRIAQIFVEGFERIHGFRPKAKDVSQHISNVMWAMRTQASRNEVFWNAVDKKTGVLCMSRRWDIVQQWTYYAREHTGFCIEFSIDSDSPLSAFGINYVVERPTIDLIRLDDDEVAKNLTEPSILTKASAWAHEHEVRILYNGHGEIQIPDSVIRSVTFGVNASEDNIRWLTDLCGNTGLDLTFYCCSVDDREYVLRREQF